MAPRILGLITCTAALRAPLARPPRAAPARAVKSALLSDYVLDLEKRCSEGSEDACDAIAQLDAFARSLEQKRDRRKKAAELLRAAGPPSVATAPTQPAPASAENFAPTPKPDSVEAALIRLFDSYDQTKSGAVALDAFTSRWVSERMRTVRARVHASFGPRVDGVLRALCMALTQTHTGEPRK